MEHHLEILTFLHEMVHCLKTKASAFSIGNHIAIFNVQEVLQTLHYRLTLVDSDLEVFDHAHATTAVTAIKYRLKERLQASIISFVT